MGSGNQSNGSGAVSGGKPDKQPFAVGDAVVTAADPVTEDGAPTQESGVIVDDFAGTLDAADDGDFGRDWALARRWAIKLDDGRLVFRSSDEVSRPAD